MGGGGGVFNNKRIFLTIAQESYDISTSVNINLNFFQEVTTLVF
jgi:hypothetical protein